MEEREKFESAAAGDDGSGSGKAELEEEVDVETEEEPVEFLREDVGVIIGFHHHRH